jgi:hypothetical protein
MDKVERRPLAPLKSGGPKISPANVQDYAYDLLRNEWSGPPAYHPDGGIKDLDDRIASFDKAKIALRSLRARISDEESLRNIDNMVIQINNAQASLLDTLSYIQNVAPYRNLPRVNRREYGPVVDPEFGSRPHLYLQNTSAPSRSAAVLTRPVAGDGALMPRTSRPTLAGNAPGGLMLSGGLLGGPGGALGGLPYRDVIAPRGKQVKKPRKEKYPTLGPWLD